jgi:hypothetical protein
MRATIPVLGAGFGGMELCSVPADVLGAAVDDKAAFGVQRNARWFGI